LANDECGSSPTPHALPEPTGNSDESQGCHAGVSLLEVAPPAAPGSGAEFYGNAQRETEAGLRFSWKGERYGGAPGPPGRNGGELKKRGGGGLWKIDGRGRVGEKVHGWVSNGAAAAAAAAAPGKGPRLSPPETPPSGIHECVRGKDTHPSRVGQWGGAHLHNNGDVIAGYHTWAPAAPPNSGAVSGVPLQTK